jgi:hypothetical protein
MQIPILYRMSKWVFAFQFSSDENKRPRNKMRALGKDDHKNRRGNYCFVSERMGDRECARNRQKREGGE